MGTRLIVGLLTTKLDLFNTKYDNIIISSREGKDEKKKKKTLERVQFI